MNLGGASPTGSNGVPSLAGTGPLTPGSTVSLCLTQAPPQTPVLMWLAFSPAPFPALGGTVHAYPFNVAQIFGSDAAGELALALTWPAGIAPSIELTLQCLVQDAGVLAGITLSNAVRTATP